MPVTFITVQYYLLVCFIAIFSTFVDKNKTVISNGSRKSMDDVCGTLGRFVL